MPIIHKAKDNSLKLILGEHTLFVEFLRDFIDIEILKNIDPIDVEDISERFLPLFSDNKDSDTVKKINLKTNEPFFVISIVEHESEVNYRSSFKLLQYITLVLNDYEKEANKVQPNVIYTKGFKYPPVLPIIFYDGTDKWTAETNFFDKTEMNDIFEKYIPSFEYELVNLNKYSVEELTRYGDTLSLIMIIDKIKTSDGIKLLSKLPQDYIAKLSLNIPKPLKKLIADVITVLLTKIKVPKEEIEAITERIEKKGVQEMFAIENYDVQETRRIARHEGMLEGKLEGMLEGKLEDTVNMINELQISISKAMSITKLPEQERENVIAELKRLNIIYQN